MSRTTQQRKPTPRPGAAKLGVDLDKKIGENSDGLATLLINQFLLGNPTAMNIIAKWAQDADFGQKCEKVHGRTLSQLLLEIEAEKAEAEAAEALQTCSAETASDSSKSQDCPKELVSIAA